MSAVSNYPLCRSAAEPTIVPFLVQHSSLCFKNLNSEQNMYFEAWFNFLLSVNCVELSHETKSIKLKNYLAT